jgi:hypothetical protein
MKSVEHRSFYGTCHRTLPQARVAMRIRTPQSGFPCTNRHQFRNIRDTGHVSVDVTSRNIFWQGSHFEWLEDIRALWKPNLQGFGTWFTYKAKRMERVYSWNDRHLKVSTHTLNNGNNTLCRWRKSRVTLEPTCEISSVKWIFCHSV